MNLYEITKGMIEVNEMLEHDVIDDKTAADTLELLSYELKQKGQGIIGYVRSIESDVEAIEAEIERLKSLKKSRETKIERLKNYVSDVMKVNGFDKLENPLGKITFRKSETTEIDDENAIPAKFKTVVQTVKIDKTEIKKAIKAGEEVPGARIEEHQNLLIK